MHRARRSRSSRPSAASSIVLLISLSAGATAQAPNPPSDAIRWHAELSPAVREAVAGRMPIAIQFHSDRDPGCRGLAKRVYQDPEILALSRRFAWVLGSPDDHRPGSSTAPCPEFGGVRCRDHQRSWAATSESVSGSTLPTAPQLVFLRPDRTLILRHIGATDRNEVLGVLRRALEWFDDPAKAGTVSAETLQEIFDRVNSNRDTTRKAAIRELSRIDDPRAFALLAEQVKPEAGEVKRQEAIKALKDARNPNTIGLMIPLLFQPSGQLKRNAVFALRNLALVEGVPPLIECYGRETTDRIKALILRTVARLDKSHPKLLEIHRTNLANGTPLMRTHALLACLDLDVTPEIIDQVLDIAYRGTSVTVQAVACYVATELLLRSRQPVITQTGGGEETVSDGYSRTKTRKWAAEFQERIPRLGFILRAVGEAHRQEDLRAYALECAKALDDEPSRFRERIKAFHDDAKDEIFKEY